MLKKLLFLLSLPLALSVPSALAAGNVNSYSYAAGSVLTSAYTVLWSSTPVSSGSLQICDTSGHLLKIAKGATGSEIDICTVQVSGCVVVPLYLPSGTQLNIRAIDATASTGYNTIGLL